MKILHTSDLHGSVQKLLNAMDQVDFDLWLDTGDFFPNMSRGNVALEVPFQQEWFVKNGLPRLFSKKLAGRPALIMPGNHDFIDMTSLLEEGSHNLTTGKWTWEGLTFSGFREIPYIVGEWAGEVHDFDPLIERVWEDDPDILVTHAPPNSILDADKGYGVIALTSALMYRPHKIQHHFFGHTHEKGGQSEEVGGIHFHNGARGVRVISL